MFQGGEMIFEAETTDASVTKSWVALETWFPRS